jgi:cell division septation protein DedD
MQIDLAQLIETLLYQNDNLVIPGLGVFTSKQAPASIDYLGGTIAPPAKVLAFDENVQTDDGIIVQSLIDEYQLSLEEARRIVTGFVDQVKTELDNREIITLPGVGRLYKNYARKIQFLPESTNFSAEAYGLPNLDATANHVAHAPRNATVEVGSPQPAPIPEYKQASTESAYAAPTYAANTTSSRRFGPKTWLLLGSFLLVSAIGLGYFLVQKKKTQVATQISGQEMEAPSPAPSINPIDGAKEAIAREEAEEMKKAEEAAPTASPNDDIPDAIDEVAAKQAEAAGATIKKPAVKPEVKPEKRPSQTKASENESKERRCVLVIGTFQDRENVEKLIMKLRANKFDTYHRYIQGHQVGVEFMYTDLTEVQKKIEELQKLTGQNNIWIKKK